MIFEIKNKSIKDAIEFERKNKAFIGRTDEIGGRYKNASTREIGMNILLGYVTSLHEISERPEVNTGIDLTYKTVNNVLPVVAWEFSAGMNPKSGYSTEKNIEIAEKTIAAYFMFLAVNDDSAKLNIGDQIILKDIKNPDSWTGVQIGLCNGLICCDLLKEIQGSVTYKNNILTIDAEKLISSYKNVTGKNLVDYGVDSLQVSFNT